MSQNQYSHVDLTVTSFEGSLPFYEKVLPELGFTHPYHTEMWKVFAADGELPSAAYVAITADPSHRPNANLIGFWAQDRAEVDAFAQLVSASGGKILDGPRLFPISRSYYSVYFQDPSGNRFEYLHRLD